ncbi:unnamed protein product [Adineta ricciae]|uniref:G-protein coupled receptors family 1 profile domain-containing protein n=1 Tax=Adineta ricciae TaxID=249248 RepID=A0A816DY05_ADIRI|nr:unnamed protein product [Adineta ricciae]
MSLNCSLETNLIDSRTVSIKYIVGGWLTLIFCVSGIVTNIFTVVVLLHPPSYPALLSYLHRPDAINRNAVLANNYEQFYARVAPYTTPLLSMLLLCSTYLTVLVSGDRYFLICWPLLAEKIRTRKISLLLVLLVFVFVNIYIIPHWFEYRTTMRTGQRPELAANSTSNKSEVDVLAELTYTPLGLNSIYLAIYRFYLNVPITFVIPFTLLTLCNGSMIHQLLLIKKKKKRLGHRMKADIRITIMLIVIVLTFMLCRSMNLFVNLLVQLSPCLNKNSLHRFNAFANLLVAFNGFVNFFLFAAFGQRFREMVLYIFFRHGQYPFPTQQDGMSTHRCHPVGVPSSADMLRRQSRRLSVTDNDAWAAMARRRSSASMAVLYSSSETRARTLSNSSYLHIPTTVQGMKNSAADTSHSPLLSSFNHKLTVSHNHHYQNSSSPTSTNTKSVSNETPTPLHVTFV